jgi:biotin carboxylase
MRRHLLIVGGNDSSAVQAAQLDVDVTLFQLSHLLTQNQINAAKRAFVFDFERLDETMALASAVHALQPFHASVSFWERALLPAAVVGESLGIPTNPLRAVEVTRDKLATRTLLAQNGLESVSFRLCESPQDLADFLNGLGRPVILKPTHGSGSAGVALVLSPRDVETAWQWGIFSGLSPLMAEEYFDGPEYSIESISVAGRHRILGVTEKFTTGPPHFIETGHRIPAQLAPDVEHEVHATVSRLLSAVGHKVGPAHTEVRLTDRGPVVIETQTRFGGDQIWEMVEIVTGVGLTTTTCASLLGLETPDLQPRAAGAAIQFFAYENCSITNVTGIDAASGEPGVVRVECKLQPGMVLGPLIASKQRQGYVLASGKSAADAWHAASRAIAKVNVATTTAVAAGGDGT